MNNFDEETALLGSNNEILSVPVASNSRRATIAITSAFLTVALICVAAISRSPDLSLKSSSLASIFWYHYGKDTGDHGSNILNIYIILFYII